MGRIRSVKPEVFKHEELFELELETGLPIRLAWIGLWTCCDREGRFKWRPRALKTEILPYDDVDFSRVLDALATRGFVVRYTSLTDPLGYIPSWKTHQYVNGKEPVSLLPTPPELSMEELANHKVDASLTREPRVPDACVTDGVKEGKGKEGKGKDKDACRTRKFQLPDWIPEQTWHDYERMRVKIRKPMTDAARIRAVTILDELRARGHPAGEVLEQSTFNSWQGLFEIKQHGNGSNGNGQISKADERFQRILRNTATSRGIGPVGSGTRCLPDRDAGDSNPDARNLEGGTAKVLDSGRGGGNSQLPTE